MRDWSGRGEHYQVEHYLALLEKAPALLEHGKPFVRMPEWLSRTRDALEDDREFVRLLLSVEKGKYSFSEFEVACREGLARGRVTAAVIEQKAFLARSRGEDVVQELEAKDCGGLEKHRITIESPEVYDQLLKKDEEAA